MSVVENITTMPVPQPANESAALIHMIERVARDPSVDIARLERLIEMRERLEDKAAERAFDSAMTEAQSEMRPVKQDATNPQTRSKYASYVALNNALQPIYTKHGFSLSFNTADCPQDLSVRVVCRVACAGHQREYHIDMPADGKGARGNDVMTRTHATMSAVSYGRRGLLKMIFNIAETEHDDDGNRASKTDVDQGPPVNHVSQDEAEKLNARIAKQKNPKLADRLWKALGIANGSADSFNARPAPLAVLERAHHLLNAYEAKNGAPK